MPIKHNFISAKSQGADATEVSKNEWNEDHIVSSTVVITNLNADLWDGYQFADYFNQVLLTTGSPTFDNLTLTSSLGAEKLTNGTFTGSATSWTLGTGWQYVSNLVRKNANGTGTLSQTSGDMVTPLVAGEYYTLTYTISVWTVGGNSVTPSCGGVTLLAVTANGTYSQTFLAVNTNDLSFLPTNLSRFYIDTISLKKTTGIYKGGAMWLDGTAGATPTSGAGTRLMWIPAKGAFRAGKVSTTQWNDANIGNYSTAVGENIIASGYGSVAMGYGINSTGVGSTAFGSGGTTASGDYAFATGYNVIASGIAAFAIGSVAGAGGETLTASGDGSFAGGSVGENSVRILASGRGSFAWGYTTEFGVGGEEIVASGLASMAVGETISATADNSIAFGKGFTNSTASSFAVGFGQTDFAVASGVVTSYSNFFITTIKSGATQAAAGAAANEVWKTSGHATLPNNVLLIGV